MLETHHNDSKVRLPSAETLIASKQKQFVRPGLNRQLVINSRKGNQQYRYPTNAIKTSKYTAVNFLPKALLQQFMRVANIYFLATAVLQSIPLISPLAPFSAIGPLALVLVVSLVREMLEDYRKHRNDDSTNEQRTRIYNNKHFVQTQWSEVRVGDFVEVQGDEIIPADMVIMGTSDETGICYVETSNLDGERNLKSKQANSSLQLMINERHAREAEQKGLNSIYGQIICEKPNNRINRFQGMCQFENELIPLQIVNLLLRGTKLKNTNWVVGIVVFTGRECKISMNQGQVRYKSTHIERTMNMIIASVLVLQSVLCILIAILGVNFQYQYVGGHHVDPRLYYVVTDKNTLDPEVQGVITYFGFFLLLNTLVPISLIISLETLKWFQTTWMEFDKKMGDAEEPFRVLNSMIHEELGKVEYVFTDKTGTLTSNQMVFKGCCIRGIQYTDEDLLEIFRNQCEQSNNGGRSVNVMDDSELSDFLDFWLCVTICHDVIIDRNHKDVEDYQGSSPDEVCLVQTAAEKYNFRFLRRTNDSLFLKIQERQLQYKLLAKIDFTSERKRMSVIVRDLRNNRIILYCKGADNIILKLLEPGLHNPEQQLNLVKFSLKKFSKQGLRTLCFSYRYLDEDGFDQWHQTYTRLQMDLLKADQEEADKLMKRIAEHESSIEKSLLLLGATALEDKLQLGVPETISDLHRAGIKIWMLTGDKLETAENIGYLCNLLSLRTKVFCVQTTNPKDTQYSDRLQKILKKISVLIHRNMGWKTHKEDGQLRQQLNFLRDQSSVNSQIRQVQSRISRNISMKSGSQHRSALEDFSIRKDAVLSQSGDKSRKGGQSQQFDELHPSAEQPNSFGLIIEGEAITFILLEEEISKTFFKIIPYCRTVICCRSTPSQKAEVVSFVKKHTNVVTLAIGDGGNDVNMIQVADIGVGILGKEGNQAAAASDYHFGQFKCLWRLLFVHGRWNYVRTSYFVNFFFFKNMLFTFQQFYFAFFSGYSAQSFWEDGYLLNYNSIVTAVAPVYFGAFDQDLSPHTSSYILRALPKVFDRYKSLSLFGYWMFLKWFVGGVAASALIFYSTSSFYQDGPIVTSRGMTDGIWMLSISCYWSSVFVAFGVIFMDSNNFTLFTLFAYFIMSVVLFFPVFVMVWDQISSPVQGMVMDWLGNLKFFAIVMCNVFTILGSKLLYRSWQWFEYPTCVDKVKMAAAEWEALQAPQTSELGESPHRSDAQQQQKPSNFQAEEQSEQDSLNFMNHQVPTPQEQVSPMKDKSPVVLPIIKEEGEDPVNYEEKPKDIRQSTIKSNYTYFRVKQN